MTQISNLYRAYIQQDFAIRKRFFDAVMHEEFHHSTNRYFKSKISKSTAPRGKAYAQVLRLYLRSRRIK